MQLVQLKVKRGFNFGLPDEFTAENQIKTAIVNISLSNELICGNVSIDQFGNIEKYMNGIYQLVITEWNDMKNLDFKGKEEGNKKILSNWDNRLKNIVDNSSENTLFIVISGEGDIETAD